jgi:ZIP family zinc transporter
MPTNDENVGVAFALVTAAGMATALGAAIVFSPTLVKYASRRTLAGALGLSSGVMTYVSFVEILQKSNLSFLDAGRTEDDAYMYSTLCFFAGVILMIVSRDLTTNPVLCIPSTTQ